VNTLPYPLHLRIHSDRVRVHEENGVIMLTPFQETLNESNPENGCIPKKWKGNLSALDNPIHVPGFRAFSREELHER